MRRCFKVMSHKQLRGRMGSVFPRRAQSAIGRGNGKKSEPV